MRGLQLLRDPLLNKGTAFTERERDALGVRGLLPPHVLTQDEQAARALEHIRRQPNDLEKMIAYQRLRQLAEQGKVDRAQIESLQRQIAADAAELNELLAVKQAA